MNETIANPVYARRLRQILFFLIVLLTFEGLARKAAPGPLRIPLFLLKDVLVLWMATYIVRMPIPNFMRPLRNACLILAFFMVPSILVTAWHDPLLAVFGIKEYLLYPVVGFATFLAFENSSKETVLAFFRWISLLIIPTACMALVQARLPADHWLNMSIGGESLEGFSAAGELRVSSTFSFVAQYCAFLNAQIFILLLALQGWTKRNLLWKLVLLALVPALVLSCFITGSRGAVVGNISIILTTAVLVAMKFRLRNLVQIIATMAFLYALALVIDHYSPRSTAAYTAREGGQLIGISSEIRDRVLSTYFFRSDDKALQTFFGNGIGVMSNGADTFSNYAAYWRSHPWTETDFATTLFEGGYYLVVVWYGFRAYVIFTTVRVLLTAVTPDYLVSVAFCEGFVIVVGTLGTLALQPPIAIWWWLGVGTTMLFSWKCMETPEMEKKRDEVPPPPPRKKIRGRSLYADVINPPK